MKTTTAPAVENGSALKPARKLSLNPRADAARIKIKIKKPAVIAAAFLMAVSAPAETVSLESAPPVVVKTVPVAGATAVDPALSEIRVTYSKPMEDGSWSWSTWGEENYPETTGAPKYLADNRTCVLPVKLQPGKFYAIWLNSDKFKNFKDATGRPAVPYLLTFFTGDAGTEPAVAWKVPVEGTINDVIAGRIRAEVERQLAKRGATVASLQMSVAEGRDHGTPFKVSYRGLKKFKTSDGRELKPPDGEFILNYLGGGQWQGTLAGVTLSAQVGAAEKIDLPFVNDSQVIGEWESVDFVTGPAQFNPDLRTWQGDLYFKEIVFLEGGKCEQPWLTWTKGVVIHSGDKTASRYEIRNIHGRPYMFFEWKSSDVTILGHPPHYYVLKKRDSTGASRLSSLESSSITEREVNRLVSEFPEPTDLSTPESACCAWQRANARMDAAAVSHLSLVPLDAQEQKRWYEREAKRDPEGFAIYLQALANSKILVVQTYREELANVITFLPFPEGNGRHPFSARTFGRVNGEWKNLGEDRLPTLDAAKANFEKKKERLWEQFSDLKAKSAQVETAPTRKFVRVVLDDQRMTFEGAPADWASLGSKLSAVNDREWTVLEWAVPSTRVTLQQHAAWTSRFAELGRAHDFEYSSYVGVHPFGSKGGMPPVGQESAALPATDAHLPLLLNDDQKAVLAWTDRQFRGFFDQRTFDGWSGDERANLERRLIDALNGPRSGEYYQAINTLAALRSTNALPKLRAIAFEHVDRNNRDRWMSVRALGLIGDSSAVPDLIHLVYHGNPNTRWWAQITLVRLTGQNFARDWTAWGKWWNDRNGQPPFKPEIIRWWDGQAEPDKLATSLEESDQKFLESLKPKSGSTKL